MQLQSPAAASGKTSNIEARVRSLVSGHPIVVRNAFTKEFAEGKMTIDEVRHFTQQFSVFSHQFIIAQLRKVIHSQNLESYRLGKEILMNELGVVFRRPGAKRNSADDVDPNVVGTEGTVDGSHYRHAAAHFEWLVAFAQPLGLRFEDLGKPWLATPSTRQFCEALQRTIGSEDASVSAGASFAIENWAAAGFWKELIQGLETFKKKSGLPLNLGFWIFHDKLEDQHAEHTGDELQEDLGMPWFEAESYLRGAKECLDAVAVFWEGLRSSARPKVASARAR